MSLTRVERLALALDSAGFDAFIAQNAFSLGYLTGFFEGSYERFMAGFVSRSGRFRLVCPALSKEQALRAGIDDVEAWRDGEDPYALVRETLETWHATGGRFAVDDMMPAHMILGLQQHFPDSKFELGGEILSSLMSIKDDEELASMKKAADIADGAFEEVALLLTPGLTEIQIAAMLTKAMERRGGRPLFCSVARGEFAAEPHHLNSDAPVGANDIVVMDFGCTVDGYASDITRTVCIGKPTDEQIKVYRTVYEAHMAAREIAKIGATGAEVDAGARRVIEDSGYGEFFTHRTGHGIGLQVHEGPYIVASNQSPLRARNCFSIEPGIYLPGRFGVRIENIVHLDESGCVSFNAEPSPELRCL